MVYLDNAATTFPKPESVYVEMDKVNRNVAVNAGRGSYKLAAEASEMISLTKNLLRKLIHADISAAVIFSPSVTIAMNQIIYGIECCNNAVIYVSPFEHNAVARTVHELSRRKSVRIKELPLDEESLEIDLDKMRYEFSKDKPNLIICTHVSNVTGYVLPIKEIFEEGKKYSSINILDSAQSLGLIAIDVAQLQVDIIAFAGHKTLYGPLGVGGFINITGVELKEYITGGTGSDSLNLDMPDGKESKFEAASANIIAIAGLNAALKELEQPEILKHEIELTNYLVQELQKNCSVKLYVPENKENHVGIVSFIVEGMNSDDVGMILDEDYDIAVRTGYHCSPFIHKYLRDEKAFGTVRVGLGRFSTKEDVDALCKALMELEE